VVGQLLLPGDLMKMVHINEPINPTKFDYNHDYYKNVSSNKESMSDYVADVVITSEAQKTSSLQRYVKQYYTMQQLLINR
jgi:hypothetical protein